jgi:TRAP-type C4-dicarboxylate transport system permease small subunit
LIENRDSAEPAPQTESRLDKAFERLDRTSERLSFEMFRFGIYVTMPALVALVTLDVTLRYVFNAPLQWARDVNGILLMVGLFCALPHAWDRAYHIRMEVFYERFTTRRRRAADVLSSLSGVIFFGFVAVQAARFVPFMIQTGETGEDLELVLWPFMAVVAFCALVMVARVLANPAAEEGRLSHHLREHVRPPSHEDAVPVGAEERSGGAEGDRGGRHDGSPPAGSLGGGTT